MADESIISSPNKLNRSIRRSRLNRKTKRFNTTYTKSVESALEDKPSNNIEDTGHDLSGTLLIMYDSEEENGQDNMNGDNPSWNGVNNRVNIDPNFDPFAEQRMLVCADRFAVPSRNVTKFVCTQGFQPCNNFLLQPPEMPLLRRNTSNSLKADTFDITDSELLQVCEENEKNGTLNNSQNAGSHIVNSPKTPETGKKSKSIVDLILEDFCSSPASPELQQSSEESNFHFQFANKPLRTYSRSRLENAISRKNIAEQYTQTINKMPSCPIEDDLLSNDSSTDLSVQEDLTQLQNAEVPEPLIDLHHSQNLCENLQNLSAYFMELSEEADRNKDTDENKTNIPNATDNSVNITLPKKGGSAVTVERSTPLKVDHLEFNNRLPTSKDDHISLEEGFKGFASDEEYFCVDMEQADKQNCDTATCVVLPSWDDDDEWNDECDFLANFDMDVVLDSAYKLEKEEIVGVDLEPHHPAEVKAEPVAGFRTASNKVVIISSEAQERATKILHEVQPFKILSNNTCEDKEIMENEESINIEKDLKQTLTIAKPKRENSNQEAYGSPCFANFDKASCSKTKAFAEEEPEHVPKFPISRQHIYPASDGPSTSTSAQAELFLGFRTASSKTINVSKEAHERAAKILQQLPELEVPTEEQMVNKTIEANASPYGGFRTASSKTIKISKEAQERAAKILQLPELELPTEEQMVNKTIEANASTYGGFRTASSKAIKISKEAQERAAKILQQLPELEVHTEEQMINKPTEANASTYGGFRTASSKTIKISKEAQERAALILKDLIALPEESNGINAKEDLENVQFSEWPVEEEMQNNNDAKTKGNEFNQNINEFSVKSVCRNAETRPLVETFENVLFSEWPLLEANEDLESESEKQSAQNNKRKRRSIDAAQICKEPTSPQHTRKLLCKSPQRSPLVHLQSTLTRSSLSELSVKTPPDHRAARGIISRKNLLSLSKKNKLNAKSFQQSKDEEKHNDESPQTPKKRNAILRSAVEPPQSPPDTPTINLQEFFNSASINTSTPHPSTRQHVPPQMRTRARKRAEMEAAGISTSPSTTKDSPLKNIEWHSDSLNKSASSSLNVSKLSSSSFGNITKMEKNPTPKQRIARLHMYGKPPMVSPIYMSSTNNCRTSGLKRLNRSVTKDGEQ